MTQSHLPGTGRGVIEAVVKMLPVQHLKNSAFSNEKQGFFCGALCIQLGAFSIARMQIFNI